MNLCQQCGGGLEAKDRFCQTCGAATNIGSCVARGSLDHRKTDRKPGRTNSRKLMRSSMHGLVSVILGVAVGDFTGGALYSPDFQGMGGLWPGTSIGVAIAVAIVVGLAVLITSFILLQRRHARRQPDKDEPISKGEVQEQ
jgi:uncharacterized membrane protein